MGLIKAGIGALGGTLADQWKEFFYCESLSSDVLLTKGVKQTTSRSSNTRGNDIITNERLARRGYYDISKAYKSLHYL